MTQTFTKHEKLVLTGLVICCVGFAAFFKSFSIFPKHSKQAVESNVNYKMGKASEELSTYNLDGREIDRQFESENKETNDKTRNPSKVADKKAVDAKKLAAKKLADKKAEDAKKAALAKNQKKSAPVVPGLANPINPALLKAKAAQTAKDGLNPLNNNSNSTGNNTNAFANSNVPTPDETAKEKKEDKVKKTYEQIRAEFYAASSKEAVLKLVTAYKKEEISAADFYKLNTELLSSQDDKLVGLGLYALRLTPSYESFNMLASYQPKNETYASYIHEALISYNQSSQMVVLQAVIRSNNKVVILKALDIISLGLNNIKSGNTSQLVDDRSKRETTFSSFSLQSYASLIPAITQALASSHDSDLSNSLESVKGLITDNTTNVAVN